MGVRTQLPETLHTSIVQGSESLQSAADYEREQLEAAWVLSHLPPLQASVMQGSPSLQSAAVLQAMQSGRGWCAQNPPTHFSAVHASLSLSLAHWSSVVQGTQP